MNLDVLKDAYEQAIRKELINSKAIGAAFPHAAPGGQYNREAPQFWTGGFWGGILWLVYRETRDPEVYKILCDIEERLDGPMEAFVDLHHDVGFMWMPTAVAHYRCDGNEQARVRGLKAANLLAGRFNLAGHFLRAWNDGEWEDSQGLAIIDCLMNLSLLYWASREINDPRFCQIALAHAETVLENFVREDGTVCHIVRFDPVTGKRLGVVGGQGKAPDSVWARGQSWAIYGFALTCRETGERKFLDAAKKTAGWYMDHLPENGIPCWDFMADSTDDYAKDTSSACCAASGMIEISNLCTDPGEKERYYSMAVSLLEKLTENCSDFSGQTQGLIDYGTVHFPRKRFINQPIIYGDFFYLEALTKLQGGQGIF